MDKEFWFTRWRKNEIGFHMTDPHHLLPELFPLLQTQPKDTILVPLCGKSLIWSGCMNKGSILSVSS